QPTPVPRAATRQAGRIRRARSRSNKRAKELQGKGRRGAKEARKRERQERAASGEADDDIDWSQAVGVDPPPGWKPPGEDEVGNDDEENELEDDAEPSKSARGNRPETPARRGAAT